MFVDVVKKIKDILDKKCSKNDCTCFINKLLRYPEKIPCDKRLHMLLGIILMSIVVVFVSKWYLILSILIIFAWSIEFYQKFTKSGTYDNRDAIAVVVGGLIVYISEIVRSLV